MFQRERDKKKRVVIVRLGITNTNRVKLFFIACSLGYNQNVLSVLLISLGNAISNCLLIRKHFAFIVPGTSATRNTFFFWPPGWDQTSVIVTVM